MHTILVVDDEADVRDSTAMLLAFYFGRCARIVTARDGAEALAIAVGTRPDLVICDWAMPNMDGATFVRHARAEPTLRQLPIVIFSGEPALADVARALDVQALVGKADVSELVIIARRLLPVCRAQAAT